MKSLIESRTFWLAIGQAVLAVLAIFTVQYPGLQAIGWLGIIKSALDIYLRTQTTQPVSSLV